jgi:hypothetical protein
MVANTRDCWSKLGVLPSSSIIGYMKGGRWLYNIPCRDCAMGGGATGDVDKNLLDLSGLALPKKRNRDVG